MKNLLKRFVLVFTFIVAIVLLVGCVTEATKYQVSFDLNGGTGTIQNQEVIKNSKAEQPTAPTRAGYEFNGWFTTKELQEEERWVFSFHVVTKDIILYAGWVLETPSETLTPSGSETIIPSGSETPTSPPTASASFIVPSMPDLSVRSAESEKGMVAAASGYAAQVGVDILEAGGNAFDAAVAVAFALNVVEPNASGIGGGGFMVAYNSFSNETTAYNYREFVPLGASREDYSGGGGTLTLGDGPGSFGVPMLVDGMLTVFTENGSGNLTLQEVMQPAINLARYGFPITASLATNISENFTKIMRPTAQDEALEIYTDGLSPLREGDILINENLAKVLEKIALEGKKGFYEGDVARAIVNAVAKDGSKVTLADFQHAMGLTATRQATQPPVMGTYKDEYQIISSYPPSSGGATLIEIFNMLEIHDRELQDQGGLKSLGHNTAAYIHAVGSATQLAFGDRTKYIGDPEFVNVPVRGLISKEFAASRWAHFNPDVGRIFDVEEYGDPFAYQTDPSSLALGYEVEDELNGSGSTSHFSIIDEYGNLVSATHTINYFFGNGYMPKGTGIHLNNILSPLNVNVNSVNLVQPGKVGVSNMSPVILLKNGEPYMTIGSPGSMRITSAVVQTILNIIEFEMSIQDAINSPRVHNYRAARMEIEGPIGQETINGLIALGHNPLVYTKIDLYFGGVQGIVYDEDTGKYYGGADPRRDGKAIGY